MKNFIYLFLFLTALNSSGQSFFEKGTLFFRDGTIEKGYIKKKDNELKFKKKITDKKKTKYTYKKISKVIINEKGKDIEYHYKIVKGKRKNTPKLLQLILLGRVSLYKIAIQDQLGNNASPIYYNYNGALYYLSKENSHIAEHVGSKSIAITRKSIKKGLLNYFKNCSKLTKKIKNKEFAKKDIIKIVEYYNTNCE